MDYQKAYHLLFNAMTDAIAELEQVRQQSQELREALRLLRTAQLRTEEWYLWGD